MTSVVRLFWHGCGKAGRGRGLGSEHLRTPTLLITPVRIHDCGARPGSAFFPQTALTVGQARPGKLASYGTSTVTVPLWLATELAGPPA